MNDGNGDAAEHDAATAIAPAEPFSLAVLPDVQTLVIADRNPVNVYLAGLDSPASRRTMYAVLKRVAAELGAESPHALPWSELRYQHVTALRATLRGRHAPAYVNKMLVALRGVARQAKKLGLLALEHYLEIVDVKGLRGSRLPAGRHLEEAELVALFGACDRQSPAGVLERALLAVLRVAGPRRAEVAALDLADLDRRTWTLRLLGKGNKERIAYVAQAQPEIEAWLALRGLEPGPLFCGVWQGGRIRTRRLGESSIAFICSRVGKRAQVDDASSHNFRRTLATELLDKGVDVLIVQRLLGHESSDTTRRYDRRPARAAAKAAALISVPRMA